MPWNLLTTLSLTPRTGPLVVSMTRVGESAVASVTATPKTTRIDVKRLMPARRRRRIVLMPSPGKAGCGVGTLASAIGKHNPGVFMISSLVERRLIEPFRLSIFGAIRAKIELVRRVNTFFTRFDCN
jgi:hypothetical protein